MRAEYLEAVIETTSVELGRLLDTTVNEGLAYYRSTTIPPWSKQNALRNAASCGDEICLEVEAETATKLETALMGTDRWTLPLFEPEGCSFCSLRNKIQEQVALKLGDTFQDRTLPTIKIEVRPGIDVGLASDSFEVPLEMRGGKAVLKVTLNKR